ncbi:hypothetical protein IJM86_00130 [bacterium]|nr:hypothetical protein [bacterium]
MNFLVDDVQEGKFFISVDNIDQNIPSKVSVSVDTDQKIKTIHWQW